MLIATDLNKRFGDRQVLRGVGVTVEDGDFLAIMGESGSGKSTFLNILAGNLPADSGSILLDGRELFGMPERGLAEMRRTSLGFVYQSLNLIPALNGQDNILLPLYLNHGDLTRGRQWMEELADRMHIRHLLSALPRTMSGGEQQRVAIARAVIHHPSVLMLDEPTGSLDSASAAEVMELLVGLNRRQGVSVLVVTHSARVASYASRTVVLSDGVLSPVQTETAP